MPKTLLLYSKFRLFTGSHFHWPRKDLGWLLGMQLSMQIYRQRFSPQSHAAIRTNKDGGELQYINCIPRGCIRSLPCQIYKKWVSAHDFVLCAFIVSCHLIGCSYICDRFTVPEGLIKMLQNYELKSNETPDKGHARLYKSLWRLLWVSCIFAKFFLVFLMVLFTTFEQCLNMIVILYMCTILPC